VTSRLARIIVGNEQMVCCEGIDGDCDFFYYFGNIGYGRSFSVSLLALIKADLPLHGIRTQPLGITQRQMLEDRFVANTNCNALHIKAWRSCFKLKR